MSVVTQCYTIRLTAPLRNVLRIRTVIDFHREVNFAVTQDVGNDSRVHMAFPHPCGQRVTEVMPSAKLDVQLLAGRSYIAPERVAVIHRCASLGRENPFATRDPEHSCLQFSRDRQRPD